MQKTHLIYKGLTIFACLFLIASASFAQNWLVRESYSSNSTVTIPDGVTAVKAEAWGGGGAGGFVSGSLTSWKASGGGGGGAYAADIIPIVNGNNTIGITIGAGGTNSFTTERGSCKRKVFGVCIEYNYIYTPYPVDGTPSIITYNGATKVLAAGGKSVTGTNTTTGAQGGQASNCTGKTGWKFSGGKGGNGLNSSSAGAGGAAADACGEGGAGTNGWTGGGSGLTPVEGGTPPSCTDALAGAGGDGWDGARNPSTGSAFGGGGSGVVNGIGDLLTNSQQMAGGAGAAGGARLTYIIFIVNDGTVSEAICSGNGFSFTPTGTIPTNTTYTWTVVPNSNVTVSGDGTTPASNIAVTSITNNTSTPQTVTFNCTATYTDTEYGFDPLTRDFTVTVTVYGKLDGGVIAENQYVCSGASIQRLMGDGTEVNGVTTAKASGGADGGASGSYAWWRMDMINGDGLYHEMTGKNDWSYTPDTIGYYRFKREYKDSKCGSIYANNGNFLFVVTSDPVEFDENYASNDTICSNVDYTKQLNFVITSPMLSAGITTWGVYWQKSIDKGENWTNLNSTVTQDPYDVNLSHSTDFSDGDDIWYRAAFKINDCDSIPSNAIYKLHIKDIPDYTDPFKDVTVTLWYGACDTNMAYLIPVLDPSPKTLVGPTAAELSALTPGEYNYTWTVTDYCDIVQTYNQKVTVLYPECGGTMKAKDVRGNEYATVRVGCDCWLAENLYTEADGAEYYNEDAANSAFGKLYDWNAAVAVNNTEKTSKTGDKYIQGVCPDGWAIPTTAQFNTMLAKAGDDAAIKSDDPDTWLTGYAGTNTSGFAAKGAGYYESNQYQRLLGYTYFWTSELNPSNTYVAKVVEMRCGCGEFVCFDKSKENKVSVRCVKVQPAE